MNDTTLPSALTPGPNVFSRCRIWRRRLRRLVQRRRAGAIFEVIHVDAVLRGKIIGRAPVPRRVDQHLRRVDVKSVTRAASQKNSEPPAVIQRSELAKLRAQCAVKSAQVGCRLQVAGNVYK